MTLLALVFSSLACAPVAQDSETWTPLRTLAGHDRLVRCLAYSPQGLLASGGQDRRFCLWNSEGELVAQANLPQTPG